MNIHIKDTNLFEALKSASIDRFIVGSHLYGLNNKHSDIDYLYLYVPSIEERNTFKASHHQLQYKEDGVDHNFVNIFVFLQNLLNGDSPLNFELIHSTQLVGTPLEYLYKNRRDFYNYKIIRAFNGFARRDIKELNKQSTIDDKRRKLKHAFRGNLFANCIIKGYDLDLEFKGVPDAKDYLIGYANFTPEEITYESKALLNNIEHCRKEVIDKRFNDGTLGVPNYMSVENQKRLDAWLSNLLTSESYQSKACWHMDLTHFYELNENNTIYYD
jgi:hypothetical protein